ncbi:hypothetical protein [Dyadobacter sp. OTU695]|uniref:hypothetical protein n=1 Tax=Dyadobacter sp. OTU695 TaxID=3043860 RepID=UPI00313CB6B6
METRIRRESGAKIIVRVGGKRSLMRFYLKDRGQGSYKVISYRDGLDKVTITELAEIQREFQGWRSLT